MNDWEKKTINKIFRNKRRCIPRGILYFATIKYSQFTKKRNKPKYAGSTARLVTPLVPVVLDKTKKLITPFPYRTCNTAATNQIVLEKIIIFQGNPYSTTYI